MNKEVNQTRHQGFLASALIISAGGLVSKLIGAVYRIPLTNLIGSYGMGLYQLIFPPYILIMTLATAGIPVAVSRMVAEYNQKQMIAKSRNVFSFAMAVMFAFGLIGSLLLFLLSKPLANWQGNPAIETAYKLIAPSVLFVCLTGAFRGFYQGNMNMVPVSMSQVMEQLAKMLIGLTLAKRYLPDINKAVLGAVAAISASELVSLIIAAVFYCFPSNRLPLENTTDDRFDKRHIVSLALPVVLGGFIMQTAQLLDSVMVVNLVKQEATTMYGLWSGPVNSLLGLPVTLTAGVAVSTLPTITRSFAKGDKIDLNERYNQALKLTILLALPCALGVTVLGKPILKLLYGALPSSEIALSAYMLALSAPSIIFVSLLQTIVATLQALKKPYVPVFLLSGGIAVKFTFNLILLPLIGINGAAISESLCYLFAATSGIIYLRAKQGLTIDFTTNLLKPVACSLVMLLGLLALTFGAAAFVSTWQGTIIAILLCAIIYFAMVFQLRLFNTQELNSIIKRRGKNAVQQKRY
jgi:stage V sporulation protein B